MQIIDRRCPIKETDLRTEETLTALDGQTRMEAQHDNATRQSQPFTVKLKALVTSSIWSVSPSKYHCQDVNATIFIYFFVCQQQKILNAQNAIHAESARLKCQDTDDANVQHINPAVVI